MHSVHVLFNLELRLVIRDKMVGTKGVGGKVNSVAFYGVPSLRCIYALAVDETGIKGYKENSWFSEKFLERFFEIHGI